MKRQESFQKRSPENFNNGFKALHFAVLFNLRYPAKEDMNLGAVLFLLACSYA